jgi:hypothetical protein
MASSWVWAALVAKVASELQPPEQVVLAVALP